MDNISKAFVEGMTRDCVKDMPLVQESIDDLTSYRNLQVNFGSIKDLKNICEEIIAQFDAEYIEQVRRVFRKFENDKL